jgi:type 1 fimbriae regulatory protein FimB/type 1 fimbriae regulatory protein FimE
MKMGKSKYITMSNLRDLAPAISAPPTLENGKVPRAKRRKNIEMRSREYLTPQEVGSLQKAAARSGRYGQRDAALVLLMYRHGLRVSEVIALRWDQVQLREGLLHVTRLKNGTPSTHPLRGPELRALRELRRQWPDSAYLFVTERGGPMTSGNVRKVITRSCLEAGLPFSVHPHMLRHSLGYKLANDGQDTRSIQAYLGHRSITNTVIYTAMSPDRFKAFFRD